MQPQDEAQLPLEGAAPEAPVAEAPTSYTLSAEEYSATLQGIAQLQRENQEYAEYKEQLARLKDPEFKQFFDQSATFYEDGKKRTSQAQEAEAPPWFKPYATAIDEFRGDRQSTVAAKEAAVKAADDQFYVEQRQYASRLKAEHKFSDEQINDLAIYADGLSRARGGKRVGFEEAFRNANRFSAGTLETPPPVLRQSDGIGGVPAPSPVDVKAAMKTRDGARATIKHYLNLNNQ